MPSQAPSTDSSKDVSKLKKLATILENAVKKLTLENKRLKHERTELKNKIIYLEARLTQRGS